MPEEAILDTLKGDKTSLTERIKGYLKSAEEVLRERHLGGEAGTVICRSYTEIIDELLKALYKIKSEELDCTEGTAMVAIGGYGRGELNIRSDIDLMLLYRDKITPQLEKLTQEILYVLFDSGLDMGFCIRSVDECIKLGREDLTTATSLLDRRVLTGDSALFEDLNSSIRKKLFNKSRSLTFIKDKLEELRSRHAKYGGSIYILEPNVKEGEGGLRDLHTARWIINATKDGSPVEPFSLGLISEKGRDELQEAFDNLLWVRNELHFSTGRKTDQLSFDQQERIAGLLGFESTAGALAVESFMQRYYIQAANLNHYSNLMLSRHLHREGPRKIWPKKMRSVDENYAVSGGVLVFKDVEAIKKDPVAAIKAFEHSQALGVELDQTVKDKVVRFYGAAGEGFRTSPEVSESFLKILKHRDVYRILREMHSLKLLDRYIPEFAEITCKVQHDMYHVYTVDAHTLFAVRELERLRDEYKAEHTIHSTIFEELKNPEVLMLAILFHDIGKAHGKGHAAKGADMVPVICGRLNMTEDEIELVAFLVKNHLILANTAQYRDMHDERLIVEFAKSVGDMERLNLLYLLTFADVRAVGPEVWSQWKGALFQELYFKALTVLERGTFEIEDAAPRVKRIQDRVTELLGPSGIDRESVEEYFRLLPQRYFLSNSAEAISAHIKTIRALGTSPYVLEVRQDTYREYTELVICTHDVHGLFSKIAGVMAANGVDILGAQINTLRNGIALDILQVTTQTGEPMIDEHLLGRVEKGLTNVLTGKAKVAELVGRRARPSILDKKHKPKVPTRVDIDNEVSDSYTVLDVHTENRIGLLYDITSTLSALGLFIHIAKIATKGEAANDIFYVRDIFGQKIFYKERLAEIVEKLSSVLAGSQEGEGGTAGKTAEK
jgi:[protein-PII] uridylyltransferase